MTPETNEKIKDKSSLDNKLSLGVKDLIYMGAIFVSFLASYFGRDTRIVLLEKDVGELKEFKREHSGLPDKVGNLETILHENIKTTRAIYDGLLSEGIIKPRQ